MNLTRVNDILQELEKQLGPLEKTVGNSERVFKEKGRVKDI